MGIGNVCHYYDVLCFLDENFHFIRKNADVSKMFGTNYQIEIIFQKFFRGRCTMLPLSPLGLLEKAFFPIWTIYTFVFSGSGLVTPIFYEDLYILYPSPLFQTLSTPALPFLATLAECEITPDLYVILLDDIMDLNLSSLGTLVPAAPCSVFYAEILSASTLICYHTQTNTQRTHRDQ